MVVVRVWRSRNLVAKLTRAERGRWRNAGRAHTRMLWIVLCTTTTDMRVATLLLTSSAILYAHGFLWSKPNHHQPSSMQSQSLSTSHALVDAEISAISDAQSEYKHPLIPHYLTNHSPVLQSPSQRSLPAQIAFVEPQARSARNAVNSRWLSTNACVWRSR